jgi:hypothetical protein
LKGEVQRNPQVTTVNVTNVKCDKVTEEGRKETISSDHMELNMRWRGADEEEEVEGGSDEVHRKPSWLKRGVSR